MSPFLQMTSTLDAVSRFIFLAISKDLIHDVVVSISFLLNLTPLTFPLRDELALLNGLLLYSLVLTVLLQYLNLSLNFCRQP